MTDTKPTIDDPMKLLRDVLDVLSADVFQPGDTDGFQHINYCRQCHYSESHGHGDDCIISRIDRCLATGDRNERRLKRMEELMREPSEGMIIAGINASCSRESWEKMSAALLAQVEKEMKDE